MDNLNFSTNNYNSTPSYSNSNSGEQKSFMVEFLIKKGIVKDYKTGNSVLLVFALILIGLSGYMMYNTLSAGNTTVTAPVENTTQTVEQTPTSDNMSDF